jgi:hypothetical protein
MQRWTIMLILLVVTVLSSPQIQAQSSTTATMVMQTDSTQAALAQTTAATVRTAWNNAFVELGGNAFFGSLNYERLITEYCSIRVGINPLLLLGTLSASLFMGDEYIIEMGAGIAHTIIPVSGARNSRAYSAILGYRYQPKNSGFLFRITFTPLFEAQFNLFRGSGNPSDFPWGSISIGCTF